MIGTATDSRTEVIFYYSGHSDDVGLLLDGQEYSYLDLRQRIQALGADVRVAIVDSCSSRPTTAGSTAGGGPLARSRLQGPSTVDPPRTSQGPFYWLFQ